MHFAWFLYYLINDPGESTDIARSQPAILANMIAFAEFSHEPAQPGTFLDPSRARHNRDRQAKFGFSKNAFKKWKK